MKRVARARKAHWLQYAAVASHLGVTMFDLTGQEVRNHTYLTDRNDFGHETNQNIRKILTINLK